MSATLLDGRDLARRMNAALKTRVDGLTRKPGLAVVLVGADPASQVYVRRKGEVAHRIGLVHRQIDLPATTTQTELHAVIDGLSADATIDGILVQLPLPPHLDVVSAIEHIAPHKDVDGLTAVNAGLLAQGRPGLRPCTPSGVMSLLADAGIPTRGRRAVVLGRSLIVGRPMAMLLEQADATVTVCHSKSADLADEIGRAEIVVAAIGRPEFVRGAWIRPGAVVVDVGMNRLANDRLVGDVAYEEALLRASAITPVPGGVGPLTIAGLMRNTVQAADAHDGR